MNEEECILLKNLYIYFKLLVGINEKLLDMKIYISKYQGDPYYMSEEIFLMSSDLLRLLPLKKHKKENKILLDRNSGILLLKDSLDLDFIENDFSKILNDNYEFLSNLKNIRNKYEHEPHNIKWCMTIGNEKDYKISFKYKYFNQFDLKGENTYTINIFEIEKIVISLNLTFIKLKNIVIKMTNSFENDDIKNYVYVNYINGLTYELFNEILKDDRNVN